MGVKKNIILVIVSIVAVFGIAMGGWEMYRKNEFRAELYISQDRERELQKKNDDLNAQILALKEKEDIAKPETPSLSDVYPKDKEQFETSSEKYAVINNEFLEKIDGRIQTLVSDIRALKNFPVEVDGDTTFFTLMGYSENKIAFAVVPIEGTGMKDMYVLDVSRISAGFSKIKDFTIAGDDEAIRDRSVFIGVLGENAERVALFDLAKETAPRIVYTAPKGKTIYRPSEYGGEYLDAHWDGSIVVINVFQEKEVKAWDPNKEETNPKPEIVKLPLK